MKIEILAAVAAATLMTGTAVAAADCCGPNAECCEQKSDCCDDAVKQEAAHDAHP